MNPIVQGWYADPEARFSGDSCHVYVTRSFTRYEAQMNIDAFSSKDLINWEKHEGIIDMTGFPHVWRAVWAPTIMESQGRYYLIFASNDIQSDAEIGGLEIAVSDTPEGPFKAFLGHPLVDRFINKAQPIDAHLFKDDDGTIFLYYGGWCHCNVARMNPDMTGFVPFEDGSVFKEITPVDYVEAPCMLKRGGKYHFMWSSGNWTDGTYRVLCSVADRPEGPFTDADIILRAQEGIADGPGHHGYANIPGTDDWRIFYHRRTIGDLEAGHRVLCMDKLEFGPDGRILPVKMTL